MTAPHTLSEFCWSAFRSARSALYSQRDRFTNLATEDKRTARQAPDAPDDMEHEAPQPVRVATGTHMATAMAVDEWLTPPHILSALGPFDLDPCAPIRRPWEIAAKHYTIKDNGLAVRWTGRVWLSPPYGARADAWVKRLAEHGNGIALIFAKVEQESFHDWVWNKADALLFLRGRIHFHFADGRRSVVDAGAPSVLVAYGKENTDRLARCGLPGKFLDL